MRDALVYPAPTLLAVCAHLTGREPIVPLAHGRHAPAANSAPGPDLADVRGQVHAKRALDDRRRRRAQPADDRSAGNRQVDAGAAPARASCRRWPRTRRSRAPRIASLAGRFSPATWGAPAVSRAASHRERGGAGRRRRRSAARRDFARASRRAVPGRVARVGSAGAGSAARAAGIRRHPYLAGRAARHVSRRSSSWSRR